MLFGVTGPQRGAELGNAIGEEGDAAEHVAGYLVEYGG